MSGLKQNDKLGFMINRLTDLQYNLAQFVEENAELVDDPETHTLLHNLDSLAIWASVSRQEALRLFDGDPTA